MKIELIFDDWKKNDRSVYFTEKGVQLSMGDFHHGSLFVGEINLSHEQEEEINKALQDGFKPVFYLMTSEN